MFQLENTVEVEGDSKPTELAPMLPPEIEREIFEIAARFRGNSVQLALVARRTQIWIERLMYETVTLSDQTVCDRFVRTLDSRPAQFFTDNVKSLCVPGDLEPFGAARVLKVCQGVVNLAIWLQRPPCGAPLFPLVSALRPKRLSVTLQALYGHTEPDFAHPFFSKVSHLELVDWPEWASCLRLEIVFQHLTHLAIHLDHYTQDPERLHEILASCRSLVVCLGLVRDDDTMIAASEQLAGVEDPRFVILSESDVLDNWEASLQETDASVWAFCEGIVVAKTGQIAAP
ncbi:hypothetical protein B0H10DRAFT_2017435 [Mycena sp. CBHHK59/15]|nr:hypothetical protein B0H10DRAFT_2017435 [Mycena sp. CBHHK59/15]